MRWGDFRRRIGWCGGRGFGREIGAAAVGYIAGWPIIGLGILLTVLLSKLTGDQPIHPIVLSAARGGVIELIVIFVLACVWAPLLEESIFRGAMYGHLRQRWGAAASILITAFIFAAIHPQGIAGVPAIMSIGIVLAMVREWRRSILPCMIVHVVHNGLAMGAVVLLFR